MRVVSVENSLYANLVRMTAVMEAPRAAEPAAGKADDLQAIVTRNIRVAMALRGVNQKDLAKVLGIATSSMSQKFTGKTLWNLVDIEKASGFFHVKPEALVAGHGFEPWTSGL
ncbi:helix-turn-helix transcriptional regulator [Bifidobacterium longum subsp. longum]|nr:helix-turn-helix domain-containing protein [Bifidobacterium longum subsp. longum]MCQ0025696.1 helix-turn-helix domain-containing protein [Bifidobacterium longum subsp. longum]NAL69948.1 helix-turn-helix transcriptional regulator [Bifidobacterium longum subsp. longum]